MANRIPFSREQYFDASRNEAFAGAKMFTFAIGTNTDKTTFTAADEAIQHTNPIIADSNGIFPEIYGNGGYKIRITNNAETQLIFESSQIYPTQDASDQVQNVTFDTIADFLANTTVYAVGSTITINSFRTPAPTALGGADYTVIATGGVPTVGPVNALPGTGQITDSAGNTVQISGGNYTAQQWGCTGNIADSCIVALTNMRAFTNEIIFEDGTYLFDATSTDLFDDSTHLIFEENAKLYAAQGVEVWGNSCTVDGPLTQHFDCPNYDTQWATATAYSVGDIVQFGYGRYYRCVLAHTSGTWLTDKGTNWTVFRPFAFFQRSENDLFVYPEWFGARRDGVTLSSVGMTRAMHCANVASSLRIDLPSGNSYYRLDRPFVILNGITIQGGEATRAYMSLRIDGSVFAGGTVGFSTEEIDNAVIQGLGYSSFLNIRFEIEGIDDITFDWCKFYFLETSKFEQCTWQSYGAGQVRRILEVFGGPVTIPELNIAYDDNPTGIDFFVEEHPVFLNLFNGLDLNTLNYQVPGGRKGLRIRPGKMCNINTIFHESHPTVASEPSLWIEQAGASNGQIANCFLQNNEPNALAVEITSNAGLSSQFSNFELRNIHLGPHDGIGQQFTDYIKINGVTYTGAQLDPAGTFSCIQHASKSGFIMGGTAIQQGNPPILGSAFFSTVGGSATISVPFSPVLVQGVGDNLSWCGLMQISGRGPTGADDRGYLVFLSLAIRAGDVPISTVTELAGGGNWSTVWNHANKTWDITNSSGNSINEVRVGFIQQGPSLWTQ